MTRVKRISAPETFGIARKIGGRFAPTPRAGPHPKNRCVPLATLVRDTLGLAANSKEIKKILTKGAVHVDGKARKDGKYPVGLFDIVTVGASHYRIIPSSKGFSIVNVAKKEATVKLCRVHGKTILKGGRIQLNLSDGKNLLVDKDVYSYGDTVVLRLPELKIESHLKREKGAQCILIGGSNAGKVAAVGTINVVRGTGENTITLKLDDKEIRVPEQLVFVIGGGVTATPESKVQ